MDALWEEGKRTTSGIRTHDLLIMRRVVCCWATTTSTFNIKVHSTTNWPAQLQIENFQRSASSSSFSKPGWSRASSSRRRTRFHSLRTQRRRSVQRRQNCPTTKCPEKRFPKSKPDVPASSNCPTREVRSEFLGWKVRQFLRSTFSGVSVFSDSCFGWPKNSSKS